MAEESFYDLWVITKDDVPALLEAIKNAETREPREHIDVHAMLGRGKRLLDEGFFDDL